MTTGTIATYSQFPAQWSKLDIRDQNGRLMQSIDTTPERAQFLLESVMCGAAVDLPAGWDRITRSDFDDTGRTCHSEFIHA